MSSTPTQIADRLVPIYSTPTTEFIVAPCFKTFAYRIVKRSIDIFSSALLLALFLPVMLVIACAVKLSSPGPLLYEWRVVGKCGRTFTGYKFRTMVPNADELKNSLWEHNERNGPTFKMKGDPRVTGIGSILRKYSLDEIPELWSILKGDMSLVGPRPVGLEEWGRFENWQRRKLSVMPGGTCLWHVRGKSEDFIEWIKLDLEYIDNWSLWLDLKILCGTAWYIMSGRNY